MASSGPSRCRSLRAAVGHPAAAAPPTIISYHDMVSALLERASRLRMVSEPLLGSGVSVLSGICDRSGSVWQLSVALHQKLKWIPILYHTNDLKSGAAGPEPSLRRCRFVGPHVTDERADALLKFG